MTDPEVSPFTSLRRRVVISGRVQGVWFRQSCRQQARAEGVGGWVRNLADGTVEAVFEGPPAAVDRLVAWCRTGPRDAEVSSVVTSDCEPIGETTFRTR